MRRILVLATVVATFVGLLSFVERTPASEAADDVPAAATNTIVPQAAAKFDSNRAWEHLRQMVAIGPRPAGSAGIRQTRAYITRQISAMGLTVQEQPFIAETLDRPNLPEAHHLLLLEVVQRASLEKLPDSWVAAVGHSLHSPSADVRLQAVRIAQERFR